MTTEATHTPVVSSPRPANRAPARRPRIDWAHNPKDTSPKDLYWFLAIPFLMALITAAVMMTALSASR